MANPGKKQLANKMVLTASLVLVEGSEIKLRCPRCHKMKPFAEFGARTMPSGVIRNQPQCSTCRSKKISPPRRAPAAP